MQGLGTTKPRIGDILRVVAAQSGISLDELRGPCRRRPYAYPRLLAYYLCRTMTDASLPKIGRETRRHHTSVLYGVRHYPEKRLKSQRLAQLEVSCIEEIEQITEARAALPIPVVIELEPEASAPQTRLVWVSTARTPNRSANGEWVEMAA